MKQIVNVDDICIKGAETVSEFKRILIEKWIYQNFRDVKIKHYDEYTILTDEKGGQMKITYKAGKLELEY